MNYIQEHCNYFQEKFEYKLTGNLTTAKENTFLNINITLTVNIDDKMQVSIKWNNKTTILWLLSAYLQTFTIFHLDAYECGPVV